MLSALRIGVLVMCSVYVSPAPVGVYGSWIWPDPLALLTTSPPASRSSADNDLPWPTDIVSTNLDASAIRGVTIVNQSSSPFGTLRPLKST